MYKRQVYKEDLDDIVGAVFVKDLVPLLEPGRYADATPEKMCIRDSGCTLDMLRGMYLGLYYAPGVVCEALKTSVYAACLFELLAVSYTHLWAFLPQSVKSFVMYLLT